MHEDRLNEILSRFQETRGYIWRLVAAAVALALAINVLASLFTAHVGTYPALVTGFLVGAGSIVYLGYARLRDNTYTTSIEGFYLVIRETGEIINVPDYILASDFHRIGRAIFNENPAFERQWVDELNEWLESLKRAVKEEGTALRMADFRIATEIAEYILLDKLSLHLSSYFNTPSLKKAELETLHRNDIPDVLLSNRVLELISRELQDRPWYKPENFGRGRASTTFATGGHGQYSRFELTLPKGSTISRTGPGSLTIDSKIITVDLDAQCSGFSYNLPRYFEKYYLGRAGQPDAKLWPIVITYRIDARIRRTLGFRSHRWPYYLWIESFTNKMREDLAADEFFRHIQWDSSRILLNILERNILRNQSYVQPPGGSETSGDSIRPQGGPDVTAASRTIESEDGG